MSGQEEEPSGEEDSFDKKWFSHALNDILESMNDCEAKKKISTPIYPEHFTVVSSRLRIETETERTDHPTAEKTPIELIGNNIKSLAKEKTSKISDPEDLIEYTYALLLTMGIFNTGARSLAVDAALNIAIDAASNTPRFAARSAAGNAASSAAWYTAVAATQVVRVATQSAAKSAAKSASAFGARYAAKYAIHAKIASRLAEKKLTEDANIGKSAYQLAEEETLAWFTEKNNFDEMCHAIFDAVLDKRPANSSVNSALNIFRSHEAWTDFKEKHFGKLSPEAQSYLTPWLLQLDGLVTRIKEDALAPS
ncbi:MAG: hypothetical protein H6618_08775 [Deltaproteobacteria bacterium]|nr:hypothetical protein [Deltaproteobacteria bacterium]